MPNPELISWGPIGANYLHYVAAILWILASIPSWQNHLVKITSLLALYNTIATFFPPWQASPALLWIQITLASIQAIHRWAPYFRPPLLIAGLRPLLSSIPFLLGLIYLLLQGATTDQIHQSSTHIVHQAESIAKNLKHQHLHHLRFHLSDTAHPQYPIITQHLSLYAHHQNIRSIYTICQINDHFLFGPENLVPNDSLASPIGTRYLKPPVGLLQAFSKQQPIFQPPYTDEYGSFISGFAPVPKTDTLAPSFVVGIDSETTQLQQCIQHIHSEILAYGGFIAVLILLAIGLLRYRENIPRSSRNRIWSHIESGIVTTLGTTVLVLVLLSVNKIQDKQIQEQIRNQALSNLDILYTLLEDSFTKPHNTTIASTDSLLDSILNTHPIAKLLHTPIATIHKIHLPDTISNSAPVSYAIPLFFRDHTYALVWKPNSQSSLRSYCLTCILGGVGLLMLLITVSLTRSLSQRRESYFTKEANPNEECEQIVAEIATHPMVQSGNVFELAKIFFPKISQLLEVDRLGLWLWSHKGHEVHCVILYDQQSQSFVDQTSLEQPEYSVEIIPNSTQRTLASSNPIEDIRLRRYAERYLRKYKITSLLDAMIILPDSIHGIIGAECMGPTRHWTLAEETCMAQIADAFGLAIAYSKVSAQVMHQKQFDARFQGLLQMSEALLNHNELDHSAPQALAALGHAHWGDRILLCRNQLHSIAEPEFSIQYLWLTEGSTLHWGSTESTIAYSQLPTPLRTFMVAKQTLHATSTSGIPEISEWLRIHELSSLLAIPLHIDMEFYGFLLFESLHSTPPEEPSFIQAHPIIATLWSMAIRRSRFKQEMAVMNEELTRYVKQLHQLSEQTTQYEDQKQKFLSNISHEVRTPINGVIGMSSLLMETPLSSEQFQYVHTIRQSGDQLVNLLNDMVAFFKMESNRLQLDSLEFDIRDTLEEVIELIAFQAQEKGLNIAFVVAPSIPPRVVGDSNRLRQILVNLLNNAVQYTWKGEIFVQVKLLEHKDHKLKIRFEIEDTGIGIAPQIQKTLLQSLESEWLQPGMEHHGLGLAVSYKLARLMGGNLGIEQPQERGSRFWFTTLLESAESQESTLEPLEIPCRALVVGASLHNRQAIATQLAYLGLEHDALDTPARAIEAIHQSQETDNPYSLLLIDIQFIHESWPSKIPCIILGTIAELRQQAAILKQKGYTNTLSEPVRHRCLQSILTQIFQKHPVERGAIPDDSTPLHSQDTSLNSLILLAEDNTTNQLVAKAILSNLGCRVDIVKNGQEALEALEKQPYDLVFMDCQMPVLDGYEATRRIRAGSIQGVDPHTPIVAMTGKALRGDRELCLECGMDDYITKPILVNDLRAVLKRYTNDNTTDLQNSSFRFDEKELMERFMGDQNLARMVLEGFLDDMPKHLNDLRNLLENEQTESIAAIAHAIYTSGSNIGARELMDLARQLETYSVQEKTPHELLEALQNEFYALEEELKNQSQKWLTPK